MPVLDYLQDIDLERFLTQIRLSGIAVGVTELQRLRSVFSKTPVLSRPQLCELFCALLGNNEEQRRTIRRIYEQLIPFDAFIKTNNQQNQVSARQQVDDLPRLSKTSFFSDFCLPSLWIINNLKKQTGSI